MLLLYAIVCNIFKIIIIIVLVLGEVVHLGHSGLQTNTSRDIQECQSVTPQAETSWQQVTTNQSVRVLGEIYMTI